MFFDATSLDPLEEAPLIVMVDPAVAGGSAGAKYVMVDIPYEYDGEAQTFTLHVRTQIVDRKLCCSLVSI